MTARTIQAQINPETQTRLHVDLGLKAAVEIEFIQDAKIDGNFETYADHLYGGVHHIRVFLGRTTLQNSGLIQVRSLLVFALLHEYRHAWQKHNWPPEKIAKQSRVPYAMREEEKDANDWAAQNLPNYRNLVRLSVSTPKPYDHGRGARGFARLSEVRK